MGKTRGVHFCSWMTSHDWLKRCILFDGGISLKLKTRYTAIFVQQKRQNTDCWWRIFFGSKWNRICAANSIQDQHHKSVILDARISKANSSKWRQMTQRFLFKTIITSLVPNISIVANLRKMTQFRRPFISQDWLNLYKDF